MLDHDAIRDELIRQLKDGTIKAVDVAKHLDIAAPRVNDLRNRRRRVQPDEMAPLVEFLGMVSAPQPPVYLPVQLPNEERLTSMMSAMLKSVGLDQAAVAHAATLARRLPIALGEAALEPTGMVVDAPTKPEELGLRPPEPHP